MCCLWNNFTSPGKEYTRDNWLVLCPRQSLITLDPLHPAAAPPLSPGSGEGRAVAASGGVVTRGFSAAGDTTYFLATAMCLQTRKKACFQQQKKEGISPSNRKPLYRTIFPKMPFIEASPTLTHTPVLLLVHLPCCCNQSQSRCKESTGGWVQEGEVLC